MSRSTNSKKRKGNKVIDNYDYESIYDKPFDEVSGEFIGATVQPPKGIGYTAKNNKIRESI